MDGRGTPETPCRKRGIEGKDVRSEGEEQLTMMHTSFFVVEARSEYQVITSLLTVRSIDAFFIS